MLRAILGLLALTDLCLVGEVTILQVACLLGAAIYKGESYRV